MTTAFQHEEFCLPRPGEDAPRVESYGLDRENDHGQVIATVRCVRCQECGAISYDGAQH